MANAFSLVTAMVLVAMAYNVTMSSKVYPINKRKRPDDQGDVSTIKIFERTLDSDCESFSYRNVTAGHMKVARLMVDELAVIGRSMYTYKHVVLRSPRTTATSGKRTDEILLRSPAFVAKMKAVDKDFNPTPSYLWSVFHGAMEQSGTEAAQLRTDFLKSPGACFFVEAYNDSLVMMDPINGLDKYVRYHAWVNRQNTHDDDKQEMQAIMDTIHEAGQRASDANVQVTLSSIFTPEGSVFTVTLTNPNKCDIVTTFASMLSKSWGALAALSATDEEKEKIIGPFFETFESPAFFEQAVKDMLHKGSCRGTTCYGHKLVATINQVTVPSSAAKNVAENTTSVMNLIQSPATAHANELHEKLHNETMTYMTECLKAQEVCVLRAVCMTLCACVCGGMREVLYVSWLHQLGAR